MENEEVCVINIVDKFEELTTKPEAFITPQTDAVKNGRKLLKQMYDFTKNEDFENCNSDALPELIIKNFDLEQIWQQIELQNDHVFNQSISFVTKFTVNKEKLLFDYKYDESNKLSNGDHCENDSKQSNPSSTDAVDNLFNDDQMLSDNDGDENDPEQSNNLCINQDNDSSNVPIIMNNNDEDSTNLSDESNYTNENNGSNNNKFKKTDVDDQFFKLNEMNDFLLTEEKNMNKSEATDSESEESVDMFKADSDSEVEENVEGNDKINNPRYKDFFGTKSQQKMRREMQYENNRSDENDTDREIEDNADDENEILKSSLELREERLQNKIKQLENKALSEKPWQLKGEVMAENRPQNSLLEEILEFDLSSRPAPVITEATTHLLEDVIKQRIKDKVFDDVLRKEKPVETPLEYKKKLMLDQEKSKVSLAQIYENEFVQQRETLNQNEEKEEEEPSLHKVVKKMMNDLFSKLDALSNYHFTPKPAVPELKIVNNLPAINMEEVAPIAASNATVLAPEEIKGKTKGDIIGKGERTDTDKNRERRKKKKKQKEHAIKKEMKLKSGLGNKYTKEKTKKMLDRIAKDSNVNKMDETYGSKSIKSSTAFFTQLQDEVESHVKNKVKRKEKSAKTLDAKKLKL